MPKLMTITQFQNAYGVSRSTIYRLAKTGDLPMVKIGRASRIKEEDAQRWLAGLSALGANENTAEG